MKIWSDYPIQKVTFKDTNYPKILKKISDPPKTLYYRGNLTQELFDNSIAVVGSRRATHYGKTVTQNFVTDFVFKKLTVISGFMYGIDTMAHQIAVDNGGATVAVLGFGLDVVYPPENEELYSKILATGGAVISEYSAKSKPHLWKFPKRNRIVSGLSSIGVLVVEAGEKSGSLVTAKIANKQGKKVYAVPGPITSSTSKGTNWLIKEKLATMVTSPSDMVGGKLQIINSNREAGKAFQMPNLDAQEQKILDLLKAEALDIDQLCKKLAINIVELSQKLTLMSLKGIITEVGGKYYII